MNIGLIKKAILKLQGNPKLNIFSNEVVKYTRIEFLSRGGEALVVIVPDSLSAITVRVLDRKTKNYISGNKEAKKLEEQLNSIQRHNNIYMNFLDIMDDIISNGYTTIKVRNLINLAEKFYDEVKEKDEWLFNLMIDKFKTLYNYKDRNSDLFTHYIDKSKFPDEIKHKIMMAVPTKKSIEKISSYIKNKATSLPTKKLSLKEDAKDTENIFNSEANNIYYAGLKNKFNLKKGLERLFKIDKNGYWIYQAGRAWKRFDYAKGLDELIKKDVVGDFIYESGRFWKQFDYAKGFDALKSFKNKYFFNKAKKYWPTKEKIEKETNEIKKSPMLPTKKLSLKEWINENT
jgi:hypothetical protein